MPPKIKISKEHILDAAFQIVREEGHETVNARTVAERLNCSTQPIMYNFKTIEELKQEVYKIADQYHTDYLMNLDGQELMPLLAVGLNYIRFGHEEKNLFRFLFQTNQFSGLDLDALISDRSLTELLNMTADAAKCDSSSVKELFRKIFIMAHGYASLYANNALKYDPEACRNDLCYVFASMKGGNFLSGKYPAKM
ncbi:MAG: TetR/AcrR family transcriptional regulator [Lachnospiraceae bacterium]|nr:TetR/AcrR family transcriptional regulator [Lachnospiraceae bacterium]